MTLFQCQIFLYRCSHHKELIFGSALRGSFFPTRTHNSLMVSLVSSRTPRSFPWKEVFHLPPPQHVLEHGAIPPREKEFFAFVELHKILLNQLVQVPLNDSKTIWCITSPPSYLLSIKLPWVHSVSSSPLLMKFLSNIHSALTPE